MLIVISAVLGLVIGSFLGVVVDRHNTGRTIGGRSSCSLCARTLSWYELIPVVSYLIQRGRCRTCASVLSLRYVLIELATALAFAGVAWRYADAALWDPWRFACAFALCAAIWSFLIIILFYDARHMIIPDRFVAWFIGLSFISLFVDPFAAELASVPALGAVATSLLLPLPFAALWMLSGGRLLGFGDIKLMIGIGFLLGISGGIAAVLLAFWAGAIVSVVLLLLKKWRFTMKSEIPFAPFLIGGTFAVFLSGIDFWSLVRFFAF